MTEKSWRGSWWLPSAADDRVPGQLVVAEDGRCELQLIGGLDLGDSATNRLSDRVPVIWGEAGNQPITLTNCFTSRRDGFSRRDSTYQDVHVHEALVGAHVSEHQEAFKYAIVTLEHLASWLTLHTSVERGSGEQGESALNRPSPDVSCSVDGWTFTARSQVQPFRLSAERSRLAVEGEVSGYIVIRPPAPVAADAFHGPVLELMDLLTLASGEASGRIELTLVHEEPISHPDSDGTIFEVERRVDSYGARIHTARPKDHAVDDWNFLFTCTDKSFDKVVPDWLALRRRAASACNVFFGMRYARPIFTEVRLLMMAIAAEALHQSIRGDETELPAAAFAELREQVLNAIPDASKREWVKARLRNVPSFRERMISLASIPAPGAVAELVPDVQRWARILRIARDNLAHTGNEQTQENIFHLERATSSLLSLVLMAELGLPAEAQERAVKRALRPFGGARQG
ncbi:HEPN domain-containing protein [Microbacterium sp. CCNWLW134]|uniref:ApeA N-terminal domain 1-containing protein n=1 Tax=Microbacterium sp. CCNWLW134 TaxID=3122064 RepID=UPI00300F8009